MIFCLPFLQENEYFLFSAQPLMQAFWIVDPGRKSNEQICLFFLQLALKKEVVLLAGEQAMFITIGALPVILSECTL